MRKLHYTLIFVKICSLYITNFDKNRDLLFSTTGTALKNGVSFTRNHNYFLIVTHFKYTIFLKMNV